MWKAIGNSCNAYTGPSAAWLLRGSGGDAFADYLESSLAARGTAGWSVLTSRAVETLRKVAAAAARLGLYCADKLAVFRNIRDASAFWPRYSLYFLKIVLHDFVFQIVRIFRRYGIGAAR